MTTESQRGGVGELLQRMAKQLAEVQWVRGCCPVCEWQLLRHNQDCPLAALLAEYKAAPSPLANQPAAPVKVESGEAELILSHLELWRNRAATSRKWERGTEVDLLSNLLDKLEAALSTRRPDSKDLLR